MADDGEWQAGDMLPDQVAPVGPNATARFLVAFREAPNNATVTVSLGQAEESGEFMVIAEVGGVSCAMPVEVAEVLGRSCIGTGQNAARRGHEYGPAFIRLGRALCNAAGHSPRSGAVIH